MSWAVFSSYVKEKNINFDVGTINKDDIRNILDKFYVEIRKQDGTHYTKQSLKCIRSGIQRRIKERRPDLDIVMMFSSLRATRFLTHNVSS